jgi:hypothetical protein
MCLAEKPFDCIHSPLQNFRISIRTNYAQKNTISTDTDQVVRFRSAFAELHLREMAFPTLECSFMVHKRNGLLNLIEQPLRTLNIKSFLFVTNFFSTNFPAKSAAKFWRETRRSQIPPHILGAISRRGFPAQSPSLPWRAGGRGTAIAEAAACVGRKEGEASASSRAANRISRQTR